MNILTQILLPLSLAFIMFTMGLSLVKEDFTRVVKYPKAFSIGFFLQVVSLPLLGFLIAWIWSKHFGLAPVFAVGLVIIAACPGGVTSNMMTYLGKGDSALSISLTAVISVLSVFTVPFIVNLGISTFMEPEMVKEMNVFKMIVGIFLITTIPVGLGMLVKAKKSELADNLLEKFTKVSSFLFILIVIAAVAKDWKNLVASFHVVGPATLSLNLLAMLIAIIAGKMFRLSLPQSRALIFECGLQNGTLAIFIAATIMANQEMTLPGAIYSLLMFVTGGVYLVGALIKERSGVV